MSCVICLSSPCVLCLRLECDCDFGVHCRLFLAAEMGSTFLGTDSTNGFEDFAARNWVVDLRVYDACALGKYRLEPTVFDNVPTERTSSKRGHFVWCILFRKDLKCRRTQLCHRPLAHR